jgi:hypothetical protein
MGVEISVTHTVPELQTVAIQKIDLSHANAE